MGLLGAVLHDIVIPECSPKEQSQNPFHTRGDKAKEERRYQKVTC